MLASLAGGGFCLVHRPGHDDIAVDFFVDIPGRGQTRPPGPMHPVTITFPSSTQVFRVGWASVAVPGSLAGLAHLHRRFGSLPWSTILEPAIAAASNGVVMTVNQFAFVELLTGILSTNASASGIHLVDGASPPVGTRHRQPDYADFLGHLSAEPDDARRHLEASLAGDCASGGGAITAADLVNYDVIERAPLNVGFRDRVVVTNPPPSVSDSPLE